LIIKLQTREDRYFCVVWSDDYDTAEPAVLPAPLNLRMIDCVMDRFGFEETRAISNERFGRPASVLFRAGPVSVAQTAALKAGARLARKERRAFGILRGVKSPDSIDLGRRIPQRRLAGGDLRHAPHFAITARAGGAHRDIPR